MSDWAVLATVDVDGTWRSGLLVDEGCPLVCDEFGVGLGKVKMV